ncbi:glycoside hydrolase family 2 protein [Nonomuraea zeae]|uniref:Glycoside hydrolase family 2 n=1 Tax=Nonomuraea zeae TaxID=1642303 RepID=A0A5S4GT22_9ACTN|nr:sugar-binding domain-containing protein [Nonomuraea zeae]TMR36066.1 glycoside hydrolase family 2 [Nonomuraea zeae]
MLTRWGASLDPDAVLPEYPRPQLVRDSYLNLNGRWEYAITAGEAPAAYDGEIVVPFSPESPLSGVNRQLQPGETLWYRRTLTPPPGFLTGRPLLHFGAVDQSCRVLLNGVEVGTHTGGYLPFTCDLGEALRDGENELVVAVRDPSDTGWHARGKQKLRRGGIWYTAQSGIWQTVWLECVPEPYVARLTLTPLPGDACVEVTVHSSGAGEAGVEIRADGEIVATATVQAGSPARLPVPGARLWSPEDPFLYDVTVRLGEDRVDGYFGMRSFSVGADASGVPRLLLNGAPYFHAGILDQGYWPDGLYTPPSDEAMVYDIATMKRLGFTMLRKHIKIEPMRWYYHCDRLGMIVWQDIVNGGGRHHPLVVTAPALVPLRLPDRLHRWFGRGDAEGRRHFESELRESIEHLRNVVSIAVWVPFNEGWGQFDAARIAAEVAAFDPTRSVDHASGWHDQGAGDMRSLHVYFRRFRAPRRRDARVLVLSEYGGYGLRVGGHTFGDAAFGYRRYDTAAALGEAFARLHAEEIAPAIAAGLSATVYTQLSDVEDELNGLLTYDRQVLKLPEERIRAVNALLRLNPPGEPIA